MMDTAEKLTLVHPDGTEQDITGLLGRKNNNVNFDEIRKSAQELETLAIAAKASRDTFAEAIKVVSAKAKVDASVLRAWVTARIADDTQKKIEQSEQLCLLFEVVP